MIPDISVVICTHNRARYLAGSLGSLARQTLPSAHFEVIFVDNASTDESATCAARLANDLPQLRILSEPTLGLSHARNAGWRAARGDVVAFLDDDAVAAPDWLEVLLDTFQRHGERVAIIGGRVDPLWEAPPPDWLQPPIWSVLSLLDLAPTEVVVGDRQYVVGANLAMRRSVLQAVGGFRADLGRRGDALLSNEEVELRRRIEALGFITLYTPHAKVSHSIPASRMTRSWLRTRHYWQGVSDAVMEGEAGGAHQPSGVVRRRLRQLRGAAALLSEALRALPRWVVGNDLAGELVWCYRWGRMVASGKGTPR